jgi:hypothetical protein
MKKAKYSIEPMNDSNIYRLKLPRKKIEVTMSFNDWLAFVRGLLKPTGDVIGFDLDRLFKGVHALLVPCQIGFTVEILNPHVLLLYAEIDETTLSQKIAEYRPQYGKKTELPLSWIHA